MIDNLLKSIKIWVSGVGESTSVQEVLFKHGVKWLSFKDQNIRFTEMPFLYVNSLGYMQYSYDANMFEESVEREVTAEWILSHSKTQQVNSQNLKQEVEKMDIKKLLAEIEIKQKRKEELVLFIEKKHCGTQKISVYKWNSDGGREARVEGIVIPIDQMHRILQEQIGEIDAFLSKYQPLIDTFNAAIKGAGND